MQQTIGILFLVGLVGAGAGVGIALERSQDPPPVAASPVQEAKAKPAVSELQQVKIDLIASKQQLAFALAERDQCRGKLAPQTYQETMGTYQQELNAMIATFEQDHPGWTLDARTKTAVKRDTQVKR